MIAGLAEWVAIHWTTLDGTGGDDTVQSIEVRSPERDLWGTVPRGGTAEEWASSVCRVIEIGCTNLPGRQIQGTLLALSSRGAELGSWIWESRGGGKLQRDAASSEATVTAALNRAITAALDGVTRSLDLQDQLSRRAEQRTERELDRAAETIARLEAGLERSQALGQSLLEVARSAVADSQHQGPDLLQVVERVAAHAREQGPFWERVLSPAVAALARAISRD